MRKKHRVRPLLAAALLLALIGTAWAAGTPEEPAETPPGYTYELCCTSDGTPAEGEAAGIITLELYVVKDRETDPDLISGSFALGYPARLGAPSFTEMAANNITLRPMVPAERYDYNGSTLIRGTGYAAFYWECQTEGSWVTEDGVSSLYLAQFRFSGVTALPGASDVGQKSFLDMKESVPKERGAAEASTDDAQDPYNLTVWNPVTSLYQGYYLPLDAEDTEEGSLIRQTDVGFRFTPPESWPKGGLAVTSYDPKKPLSAALYDKDKNLVADVFTIPAWGEAQSDGGVPVDSDRLYSATEGRANTGIGRYTALVEVGQCWLAGEDGTNTPVTLTAGEEYTLLLSKPGHLSASVTVTAQSEGLSDAESWPEGGVYLPCGDVAPNPMGGYGDGAIKLADRSVLLAYLDRQIKSYVPGTAADLDAETGAPVNQGAWLADLDGDGSVTLADLNILMAAENYNQ